MTYFFGDKKMAQEIANKMPLVPNQVVVTKENVKGEVKISAENFEFNQFSADVIFYLKDVNEYNAINTGAVGAEATAQMHRVGTSNLVHAIKAQMPEVTSIRSTTHTNLIEYHLGWSVNVIVPYQ